MKISKKKLDELLKAIGIVDAEVVEDLSKEEDADVEALVAQVDGSRHAIIEPQVREAVKTELESGFKARMIGTVKSSLNRLGIKLTDEFDTVDAIVKKALDTYNDKFSQDTESLRNDMAKMVTEHNEAMNAAKNEYESQLRIEHEKFIDRDTDEILQGYLKAIPRIGGDDIMQAKQAKAYLRDNYHLHYDAESKKVELRQKDKPEQPVYNEQRTKIKGVDEAVRERADKMGIVDNNTKHTNPINAMNGVATHGAVNDNKPNVNSLNPLEANEAALRNLLGE